MRAGTCDWCGEPFEDRSRPQTRRFCSDRCRRDEYAHRPDTRGTCEDCGRMLGPRRGRGPATKAAGHPCRWCIRCYHERCLRRTAERAHRIEAWWREGLSMKEIADRLGWTVKHLSVEMTRLRRKGFDLPHRCRIKHGRSVAA